VFAAIRALGLLLIIGALGGCAAQRAVISGAAPLAGRESILELADTPFHPQAELQCGPAALATVLGAAGDDTHPDALVREIYTPGLGGSLQLELVAAARARGFLPYRIAPELDALLAELVAGRPVLVLQNLGLRSLPAWHYAVVIGADPASERLHAALRHRAAPAHARGALPAQLGSGRPLGPGAARAGRAARGTGAGKLFRRRRGAGGDRPPRAAARAWEAAVARWPDDPVARFGLATARYLAGELPAARAGYEALIELQPEHAGALNNLAHLLAELGCPASARPLAERAVAAAPPGSEIAAAAAETLRELPADAPDAAGCAPSR
jgi:tetratricopeptide (TPR) repeat protein